MSDTRTAIQGVDVDIHTERVDGQAVVDLLAAVGITDYRKVVSLVIGPDPAMVVRRFVPDAEGKFRLGDDGNVVEETLWFGVDWPK